MKKINYKNVKEIVYTTTLKNNMNVYLLYKPGFIEKTAYIVTQFGHFDSLRKIDVAGKKVKIPWGAAHFLEHRMFSINQEDASDLFAKYGASCNAYTTYEKTAYYFSCQKNFYECLKILLTMMDSFSSTADQIENEKSIILQEASMYKEEPNHILNSKIFSQGYLKHPINKDIIGTTKTIKNTTKEQLEAIFNTFYDPSNLTLVICGDINPNMLESFLNDNLLKIKNPNKIKPLCIKEPLVVKKDYSEIYLNTITVPRVAIMYKLEAIKDKVKKDKMYFCYNLILDYLFDSSGKLSEKWLNKKIISTLLEYSVSSNVDLDCIIFYNICENADLLISNLKKVFSVDGRFTMNQDDLDLLKKTYYGATLKTYESVSGLCSFFVYNLFTSASDLFDEIKDIEKITLDDIYEAYNNICNAVSTVVLLRRK